MKTRVFYVYFFMLLGFGLILTPILFKLEGVYSDFIAMIFGYVCLVICAKLSVKLDVYMRDNYKSF